MFNKQNKISRGAAHFLAHFFAIIAPLMKMAIVYNHRFNLYDCCFINSHDHDFDFIGNTHKRALTECIYGHFHMTAVCKRGFDRFLLFQLPRPFFS